MLSAATGGIREDHTRWNRAVPRSIIASQRPEVSGLGPSGPWIKDRSAGLVHEQLGGTLQVGRQRVMDGAKLEGSTTHPIRKGETVEDNALTAVDLGQTVKRKVV